MASEVSSVIAGKEGLAALPTVAVKSKVAAVQHGPDQEVKSLEPGLGTASKGAPDTYFSQSGTISQQLHNTCNWSMTSNCY